MRPLRSNRGTHQQRQLVEVLRDQPPVTRHCRPGAVHAGARLHLIQCRQRARPALVTGQAQAALVSGQGFVGQGQQRLVGLPGQVHTGNARHQAQAATAPCLVTGQVVQQCLVAEAAHPAEQVDFVGAQPQRGRVAGTDHAFAGTGHAPGQVLTLAVAISRHLG